MKKLFILAASIILSLGSAAAQVNIDRGYGDHDIETAGKIMMKQHRTALAIKYGAKVGVNISNMSSNMTFDPEFAFGGGFQIGALINLHWGQRTASSLPGTGLWGVQSELLYSHHGINSSGGTIRLNYIKLPVLLKVYPLASLGVEIGPEFSYLFATTPKSIVVDGASVKVGDCRGFNCGLAVGAAYEFNAGLTAGIRYSLGFADLGKNLKWNNRDNIQIYLGWLF